MVEDERRDRRHVVEAEPGQLRPIERLVAGKRHDRGVLVGEQWRAALPPMHLELGVRETLEAFDDDEVDRVILASSASRVGSGEPRSSWITAQRRAVASTTSSAPASRWRQVSLPG